MNKNHISVKTVKSEQSKARWLSEGFEELVWDCECGKMSEEEGPHFDVVIVGSGYGGALAASELAGGIDKETGKPMRICVLERGKEYLAGMFPTSESDLPGSITFSAPNSPDPYSATDGVLDLRLGEDVSVMLASGLGGGSLINAGVMAKPEPWVLEHSSWPTALRTPGALAPWYAAAQARLAPNKKASFDQPHPVKKREALFRLHPEGPLGWQLKVEPPTPVNTSIAADATENSAGVKLNACLQCGDCMTGCNHQAKNSLDQNLLVKAKQSGVRIVCGASVLKLTRGKPENESSCWILEIVHTDPLLRRRRKGPFKLRARRVILAAGTLGSTEILLRSRSEELKFSPQLGQRFSTNGDFIAASYGEREEVNAAANATQPFSERKIGPTITGMMKVGEGEEQITIEELAIPGTMRRLFEEGFTTAHLFDRLANGDPDGLHLPRQGGTDPYAVQEEKIKRTQVLGVIGHDGAKGRLALRATGDERETGHPQFQSITVLWPELRERGGIFDRQVEKLTKLVANSGNGGVLLPNPFWQLLPTRMTQMLDMPRGPGLTTHPLGGCAMADKWEDGVVNEHGEIFNPEKAGALHHGLVILDGAIIPRSLGTNPAFTISALVLRALDHLKKHWQTGTPTETRKDVGPMPIYKTAEPAPNIPTEIAIHERLVGDLELALETPWKQKYTFEVTLQFESTPVRELATSMARTLKVDPCKSRLRIFKANMLRGLREVGETEFRNEQHASFCAPISGSMRLLDREESSKPVRILRSLYAWWHNRGKRDLWSSGTGVVSRGGIIGLWEYVCDLLHVASHAGEARLFDYNLVVGKRRPPLTLSPGKENHHVRQVEIPEGTLLRGRKRLTYERRSNPWTQMLEVTLTEMSVLPADVDRCLPWLPRFSLDQPTVLKVDGKHYAREHRHLFEITKTRDGVAGMFDLFSFGLYAMRLVAAVHLWSFRKPDEPPSRRPNLLPGELSGMPAPTIDWIPIDTCDEDDARKPRVVKIRLTRYQNDAPNRPVLLIHGYSASGTTFAHPALRPSLAEYLYKEAKRDVWVIDLRTSAGLETCKHHWSFEQVATQDIPKAFAYIREATGAEKIDVVAHCMGAAMFSMALLDEKSPVVEHVNRVVLSQVGPMVAFTPDNIFRAYSVSYIQQVLRESNFDFRPEPGLNGALLDRLLATVPYPREEFDFENPPEPWARTPFTTTRHRMDAWFGRAFNVANMSPDMLNHIDDFFGAINLDTLFQTIHFARNGMITTKKGGNAFIIPERLLRVKHNGISIFSIHGAENGLADPATLIRMQRLMKETGIPFQKMLVPKFGHQDCVMGRDAPTVVFPEIVKFLDGRRDEKKKPKAHHVPVPVKPAKADFTKIRSNFVDNYGDSDARTVSVASGKSTAHIPFMGPLVGLPDTKGEIAIAFAADPKFGPPVKALWIPAAIVTNEWRTAVLGQLQNGAIPKTWVIPNFPASTKKQPEWLDTPTWYQCRIDSQMPRAAVLVLLCGGINATTKSPNLTASLLRPNIQLSILAQKELSSASDIASDFLILDNDESSIASIKRPPPGEIEALRDLLRRTSKTVLREAHAVLGPPQTGAATLRFAVASCQYPAGPLDPGLCAASYTRLGKRLDDPNTTPRCAVLMGDQIYADATAGLFDPIQMDDRYELPYQDWLTTPEVRNVLRRLPLYATLDDHEIDNNWERDNNDTKSKNRRNRGLDAFFRIQRAAVTECAARTHTDSPAFATTIDQFEFFFADGRTERKMRRVATVHTAKMIPDHQFATLLTWLAQPAQTSNLRPRFVVTGSILLPRRKTTSWGDIQDTAPALRHFDEKNPSASAINSDAWDGYPDTFYRLLAHIANRQLPNLVFLSGDEHHSCIATARLELLDQNRNPQTGTAPTLLHSIHSSALYAPYPFANGEPAQLTGEETFEFENPESAAYPSTPYIRCTVATRFVKTPGDGFAMLDCTSQGASGWNIRCEFSRPDGCETYELKPDLSTPIRQV